VIPSVSFYLGRFRQEIGVVNRWHEHDLDQTGYPLVLDELLGEGGMTGDGVGLTWHMGGWWAHANELTLQVADGYNERLFSGEHFSVPTVLAHLKSYYDLNEDTYLELGLSGMFGGNHRRGYEVEDKPGELFDEHWRSTWVAGADLTVFWEPLQQAKYYNVTWRTEFLYADKEIKGGDVERGWGLYSYLQAKVNPAWFVGVRGDLVEPLERERDQYIWQVVPYITFWQSEFVYLRLEGRYGDNFDHGRESRILFQLDFAAGPHKHEKY